MLAELVKRAAEWQGTGGVQEEPLDNDREMPGLDFDAFPRFASFLRASEDYAKLSGFRFRASAFSGLPTRSDINDSDAGVPEGSCPLLAPTESIERTNRSET